MIPPSRAKAPCVPAAATHDHPKIERGSHAILATDRASLRASPRATMSVVDVASRMEEHVAWHRRKTES
jgi:hypothetical protein